jgi:tRNA A37 threonylcarbamoyladenosine dehydratase
MGYGSASFVTATIGFVAVSRVIEKSLKARERQAAKLADKRSPG